MTEDELAEMYDQPYCVVVDGKIMMDTEKFKDGLVTGFTKVEGYPWWQTILLFALSLVVLPVLFMFLPFVILRSLVLSVKDGTVFEGKNVS